MIRTYRFRVYPTDEQKAALSCSFGSVRYVYNAALAYRCKAYERRAQDTAVAPVRLRQCFLLSEKPHRVLDKHRAGDDPLP